MESTWVHDTLSLRGFEEEGMGFEELGFECWVEFGLIESFGFGEEIDGDVGHAKKVGFLNNGSGQ